METYILKIGGSSVTEKGSNKCRARTEVIRRIADEIRKAKSEKEFRLVVVHGAGPFGHRLVTDYKIKNGVKTGRDVEGFVRTHNSMEDLNKVFMDIFREQGLLGFPIQTSACVMQDGKKIAKFDTEIIERLIRTGSGITPILYGDMVIDKKLVASVVSGDAIVPYLAKKLKASRVFMGTDVDGIFTADPKLDKNARLIERIDRGNFNEILKSVGGATTVDVTGGMRGKLLQLRGALKGIDTIIFDITKEGNTYKALIGQKIRCTEIML
jgi:isopentenyl phosphate kinase